MRVPHRERRTKANVNYEDDGWIEQHVLVTKLVISKIKVTVTEGSSNWREHCSAGYVLLQHHRWTLWRRLDRNAGGTTRPSDAIDSGRVQYAARTR